MLHQSGTHTYRMTSKELRWFRDGRLDGSTYRSFSDMLVRLGWRTHEQRRADSRLVLCYKIVHGLVTIPLPAYVIPLNWYFWTRHSLAFRQLYVRPDYFLLPIVVHPLVDRVFSNYVKCTCAVQKRVCRFKNSLCTVYNMISWCV